MTARSRVPSLTNVDIVTFALAQLGGIDQPIHLEEIAMKAYEYTPGAFRWDLDQYSECVDKDKVRVSLTDAEKTEKGGLVRAVGVTRSGTSKRTDLWRLTSAGATWVVKNSERIQETLGEGVPRLPKKKAGKLRRRIESSSLFKEFIENGDIEYEPYSFTDLLECSPDASEEVVHARYDQLKAQVLLLDDANLVCFIDVLGQSHAGMFGEGAK